MSDSKNCKKPNAPNVERFLLKYFRLNGVPRQIGLDQARCIIGNTVKTVCEKNNVELLKASTERHRSIGLVDTLIQTLKRRLGCMKIECGPSK